MARKDKFHEIVKKALIKEGWVITDDPYLVVTEEHSLEVDLGAEKLLGAQKGSKKIAVEIKSFLGLSKLHDYYKALGQFNYYSVAIDIQEPERTLFLAVPLKIYKTFFQESITLKSVERFGIKILVYNIDKIEIELWKE